MNPTANGNDGVRARVSAEVGREREHGAARPVEVARDDVEDVDQPTGHGPELDGAGSASLDWRQLKPELTRLIEQILRQDQVLLNIRERDRLIEEVQNEVLGLGPLEPLLQDPSISDILVNTGKQIYVERSGKLELLEARFRDDEHL